MQRQTCWLCPNMKFNEIQTKQFRAAPQIYCHRFLLWPNKARLAFALLCDSCNFHVNYTADTANGNWMQPQMATAKISTCRADAVHPFDSVRERERVREGGGNFEWPKGIKAGQKLIATEQHNKHRKPATIIYKIEAKKLY